MASFPCGERERPRNAWPCSRSTLRCRPFLAVGSRSTGREKVHAIDHFRGSPEHQPGQRYQSDVLVREGSTFPRFCENLQNVGLREQVQPLIASSTEAARDWNQPIRLLFIDGDHSYECSRQDFELWAPFLVRQGILCLHDVNQWPGVTQFYQELVTSSQAFQELATVCSMKILQRR